MKLSSIKNALEAAVIVGEDKLDISIKAGAASDLMSDVLKWPTSDTVLLTGLNTIQSIRTSVIANVSAIVIIRGKQPSPEMISHAAKHSLPLLTTPFPMFSSCGKLFDKGLRGVET